MKKVFQKNQIAITALAIMIAVDRSGCDRCCRVCKL